ncbi:MAG: hypothetical protein D6679_08015 [Candidatus Hydrogenedentota bacterium]|nr:MAG: hypothetical protein D6679_08015 [Candidatus Hydrogenedentota bacterium]
MKCGILLLAFGMTVLAASARVNMDFEDASVEEIVTNLFGAEGKRFVAEEPLPQQKSTIHVENSDFDEALSAVLEKIGFSFRVDESGVYHLFREEGRKEKAGTSEEATSGRISLEFSGDVREAVQLAFEQLTKKPEYVIMPEVGGKTEVNFRDKDLKTALKLILTPRGYEAVEKDGVIWIQKGKRSREGKTGSKKRDLVTKIIEVKKPAEKYKNIVKNLLTPGRGKVVIDKDFNLVIITDTKEKIAEIENVISRYDTREEGEREKRPGQGEKKGRADEFVTQIYKAQYKSVGFLEKRVRKYLSPDGNIYADEEEGTLEIEDKKSHVDKILYALKTYDIEKVRYVTIKKQLNFSKAEDLVDELRDILSSDAQVTFNERTNRIFVRETEENADQVVEFLNDADQPPLQVSIEATILDLQLSGDNEFGIDWQAVFNSMNPMGSNFAVGTNLITDITVDNPQFVEYQRDMNGNLILGANNDAVPVSHTPGSVVGNRQGAFVSQVQLHNVDLFGHKDLIKVLTARLLASKVISKADILASPKINVINNEQALIEVGSKIPFVTSTTTGGAATENITFEDAVLSLEVTPTINPDHIVNMRIDLTNDRPGPSVRSDVNVPVILKQHLTTNLDVKSGNTVILGGLDRKTIDEDKTGVPILMDIPLLGRLFSRKTKTQVKRELVLFITPTILPSPYENDNTKEALRKKREHEFVDEKPVQFVEAFVEPEELTISRDPDFAGDTLRVTFRVDKELRADPMVLVAGRKARKMEADGKSFSYAFSPGVNFPQGRNEVMIRVEDKAGNENSIQIPFSAYLERFPPEFTNIKQSPRPGVMGEEMEISFRVNKTLKEEPKVRVGGKDLVLEKAGPRSYRYKFQVPMAPREGRYRLEIEGIDLDGNVGRTTTGVDIVFEKTPPNLQFKSVVPATVALGETLEVNVVSNEALRRPPVLLINGHTANLTYWDTRIHSFTFQYRPSEVSEIGRVPIKVRGIDKVGNLGEASDTIRIIGDHIPPVAREIHLKPKCLVYYPGGKASRLLLGVDFTEDLAEEPHVYFGKKRGEIRRHEGRHYEYEYAFKTKKTDEEELNIRIEAVDEWGNHSETTIRVPLRAETEAPEITEITVEPREVVIYPGNRKKRAEAIIRFKVSEKLKGDPLVTVGGHLARKIKEEGGIYLYKFVLGRHSSETGVRPVRIVVTDLAGNSTEVSDEIEFVLENEPPAFRDLRVLPKAEVMLYPGDPKKKTRIILLKFEASEELRGDPEVTVGGKPAQFVTRSGLRYTYRVGIESADTRDFLDVIAAGRDLAGNFGRERIGKIRLVRETKPPIVRKIKVEPKSVVVYPGQPEKNKEIEILFEVDEPLGKNPEVYVGGNPARFDPKTSAAPFLFGFSYRPGREEREGAIPVVIKIQDLAGNKTSLVRKVIYRFEKDPPVISDVHLVGKPLLGSWIKIIFRVNETLVEPPSVIVSGRRASFENYDSKKREYVYRYHIPRKTGSPQLYVEIVARDLVGNEATFSGNLPAHPGALSYGETVKGKWRGR